MNKTKIHATASGIAFITILTFWTSTALSELFASDQTVAQVKLRILYGMIVLIPALMITGGSGFAMAGQRQDTALLRKKRRMPIIASTGLIVLLPAAFFLESKAATGQFDTWYYAIQSLELLAGASNLRLIFLNMRDGLRLTGKANGPKPKAIPEAVSIEVKSGGPLLLKGLCSVAKPDGTTLQRRQVTALCRCGASQDKPHCDGSHNALNFDSEPNPPAKNDRIITYQGQHITVKYNPLACSHAAICGAQLKAVFDSEKKPWIQPDAGSVDAIKAVVKACPSGALSYALPGAKTQHLVDQSTGVAIESNGPYHIKNIPLKSANQAPMGACPDKYVLCRCGASKNKPFCDGSHVNMVWDGD